MGRNDRVKKSLDVGTGSNLYTRMVSDEVTRKSHLSSGELAGITGVSRDTLRHYEKKGVLARPQRTPGGYRQYPAQAVERILLIRQALKVGFTLDELARILKIRDRGGVPCRQVKELAASKLTEIEARLRELLSMRDALRGILTDWETRLEATADDTRAALLDSLAKVLLPVEKRVTSGWPVKKKGRKVTYEKI